VKHSHDVQADVNLHIPKEDIEDVIDKVTDSVITIVVVSTFAHLFKKWACKGES
jgi:hypothetical protein